MHACALTVEIHLPASTSLKAKRAVVRHLLDASRARYRVAAAEVAFQDQWQRSVLGFAAVSGDAGHLDEVVDALLRFVWSHPEIEVVATSRDYFAPD